MPQRLLQIVTKGCATCAVVLLFGGLPAYAGDLLIQVEGNRSDARLYLAVVHAEQKDWHPILREQQGQGSQLHIADLPPGRYALQLFQDSNGNGQLDVSPRGIPLEPVGFSGNKTLFGGKPLPSDSSFEHGDTDTQISIRLRQPRAPKG